MSVQGVDIHTENYNVLRSLGNKAVASDTAMVIDGFESAQLLTKQFPRPVNSPNGAIEVPGPLGTRSWQPLQARVDFTGAVTFREAKSGSVNETLKTMLNNRGIFSAWLYEGTGERYTSRRRIVDCFMIIEAPDLGWEERGQMLMFTGAVIGRFFGAKEEGNFPILTA